MITEQKIVEIINQTLELNLDPVSTPKDVPFKSLGIDSLDFYNVLVELENVTGKKVPDEDVESILTIQSISNYFS